MFLYIGGSGWVYSESLKVEKEKFSKRVYLALSLSSPSPSLSLSLPLSLDRTVWGGPFLKGRLVDMCRLMAGLGDQINPHID